MDKKLEFNDALSALIEYATVNGNEITTENVHTYFDDILDSNDKFDAVFKYLIDNKIRITDLDTSKLSSKEEGCQCGSESSSEDHDHHHHGDSTEEEKMFLEMYMKELKDVPVISPEEKAILIEKGCRGDRDSFSRLIEAYLPTVMEYVDRFMGQGVRRGDLIQEGNLGLIEGIMNYDNSIDFDTFIGVYIEKAIKDAIDEELSVNRIAAHAADRANAISDATTELAEKLGREATIEELCEYMSLTEDEIRDVMKMSLDAMTITTNAEDNK
jgi:RNA polymerase primary sigma factor